MSEGFTVYHRPLPETDPIEDHRLGRHVTHDSRSLAYRVAPVGEVKSREWDRKIPVLDQGNLGSCTGNAACGVLGTEPYYSTLGDKELSFDEGMAVALYAKATQLDSYQGDYPPDDTGSDGLSVAKAAEQLGYISGYLHAASLDELLAGLQGGPMIVGTNWYADMFTPTGDGRVRPTGKLKGGHEYECFMIDVANEKLWFWQSWGLNWGVQGKFWIGFDDFAKLLSEDGDATSFVPVTQPAPTPAPPHPAPAADAAYPGVVVPVNDHIHHAAARSHLTVTDYMNRRWSTYFDLNKAAQPHQVIAGREREIDRDARTGEFVKDEYAAENPGTTSHEHVGGHEDGEGREAHRSTESGKFVRQGDAEADPDHTEKDHLH